MAFGISSRQRKPRRSSAWSRQRSEVSWLDLLERFCQISQLFVGAVLGADPASELKEDHRQQGKHEVSSTGVMAFSGHKPAPCRFEIVNYELKDCISRNSRDRHSN